MIQIPNQVVNPFSEKFMETWILWKSYMLESHGFQYKGIISEQMALKRVVEVSEGDEEKAVRIIHQSIGREWRDFFELKQPNPNGKSKKQSATSKAESGTLRERVAKAVNKRYGGGEQETDSSHSKAV